MQAKVNGEQHAAKMKHILKTLVELLYPHELFMLHYQAIPMTNEHCIVVKTCIVCIRLAVKKVIFESGKINTADIPFTLEHFISKSVRRTKILYNGEHLHYYQLPV